MQEQSCTQDEKRDIAAIPNTSYRLCSLLSIALRSVDSEGNSADSHERVKRVVLIAYLVNAWSYSVMDSPLLKDAFIATKNGPTPSGLSNLKESEIRIFSEGFETSWCFSQYEKEFIEKVVSHFTSYTMKDLILKTTGDETPYYETFSSLIEGFKKSSNQSGMISEYIDLNGTPTIAKGLIKDHYLLKVK